jgi:hypothetical protein
VWLHIDGAWGGAAVFNQHQRSTLMGGAEQADSFCWNPHKAMGAPLQCAQFISRHPGLLQQTNGEGIVFACVCVGYASLFLFIFIFLSPKGTNASYLFQPDKENTEMDTGDKTFQCGRKVLVNVMSG